MERFEENKMNFENELKRVLNSDFFFKMGESE